MKLSTSFQLATVMLSASAIAAPATGPLRKDLETRHSQMAEQYRQLDKRQDPVSGIVELATGVFALIIGEAIGTDLIGDFANALAAAFNPSGPKAPWENSDNCIIEFHTHGGENCYAKTTPASQSGNSSSDANLHDNNWNVCPWINPASTAPPVQYFTDPGIGAYSVQFTATDTVAWADAPQINGTVKCVAQGLCNPQLVFYRSGYNLVIDTWKAHDDNYGGYSDQYAGLCNQGDNEVQDQFSKGGDVLGDTCAIPCWNQASLPDPHST